MELARSNTTNDVPEYIYYDPIFVPGAFGFNNTGAICWGNSMIQFMLGMSSINQILLEQENNLAGNPFATEYIKLLKQIAPNTSEGCRVDMIDPSTLAAASSRILVAMIKRMQVKGFKLNMGLGEECADEAFTMFVDMLGCHRVERLLTNIYEMSIRCSTCKKVVSATRDKMYRVPMFTPVRIVTEEVFSAWIRNHPSPHDCFKCECGAVMLNFNRQERLKKISEVLVIIFNKFQEKGKRWFPQRVSFPSTTGPNLNYELVGKIEHSGSMNGGHYWAQTFRDDAWTCLNDNATPSIGSSEPTANTFMIAYHLVRDA